MGRRAKETGRADRGQISLMVGMMLMTFLLFFAFVVNTGMLVNAKINLQNAADLAAYSGAAAQARLLNQISYLNYEMRREYKKFLFRYYVIGNMAQDSFPRVPGPGKVPWAPGTDTSKSLNVPAVCMIFNTGDNYCHLIDGVPEIAMPPSTPLDSINQTLRGVLQQIEAVKEKNCDKIGQTNYLVLLFWLYNVDPSYKQLPAMLSATHDNILSVVRGMAYGLGLLPRELILRMRIRTLESYVNTAAAVGFKKDQADSLQNGMDPMKHERTLNAFLSAYNTLGNHTFPSDSIVMDELLPEGQDGARLLKLNDIRVSFDAYSVDLNSESGACVPTMIPMTMPRSGVSMGVYKDPTVLTYYAVRLKAKARVLFSPFGEMELKAYSAAQPFGSRIGPALQESHFVREAVPPGMPAAIAVNLAGKIPNVPMLEDDSAGTGKGWDSQKVAGAMYQALGGTQMLDQSHFQKGYQTAMAPAPWEAPKYNILVDDLNDEMTHYFDMEGKASFWAPVFPPGTGASVSDELKKALDDLFPEVRGDAAITKTSSPDELIKLRESLRQGMGEYIGKLMKGEGEGGEGFKIVHIRDPLHLGGPAAPSGSGGSPKPIGSAGGVLMTEPDKIKTSWSAVETDSGMRRARVGYSVKFVSFETLTRKDVKSSGTGATWENDINGGAEGEQDIPVLSH